MKVLHKVRIVNVAQNIDSVADFIKDISNWPSWTNRFEYVDRMNDAGAYPVLTRKGPALVTVDEDTLSYKRRINIRTWYEYGCEVASVELRSRDGETNVLFHNRVPVETPRLQMKRMLADCQADLRALQGVLAESVVEAPMQELLAA